MGRSSLAGVKRSPALAPLSRDHHLALVLARRLTRAESSDAVAVAAAFVEFLDRHELAHFALEEAVLLPVADAGEPGAEMATRVRSDHAQLRADLQRLRSAARPATPAELHEIGERLRAHVRLEEQELFPYIEATLDEDSLATLGAELARGHGPP